ncbi:efflux RND transporter permease subunit [Rhodobacteraceae bacterium HSP-20]|uniref:Efflux RND transporter permease subunit n=1 Tax=Paragemmobacter amnigenus TaxID=2852097 RepID=A0ABS6J6Z4_9RHOB|nr:efflux RND transporter permease subunit [Rhodobacter amnigenus]MBU9699529.1 efflux RND transporter permease subunit [Rhodobacter amnigenus]MBV4390756.1 efflux RND transporter permease subunit [Rhodobacter amnigenus]
MRSRGILSYFTRHRTLANLLMVLMLVGGVVAALDIRAQYFPDVVLSEVDVSVTWQGAGAEDVDRGIVQVLEPALKGVEGVAATYARSVEGRATVEIEFEPGVDIDRAAQEVTAAVEGISTLPEGADEPEVSRGAWRDQVTDVVITGPVGVEQLARLADEFTARLFAAGVTRATISGLAAPEMVVEVSSVALMRHDLTMAEVAGAVAAAAGSLPAGEVASGAARVRTGEALRTAEGVSDISLRVGADGAVLRLRDVAVVRLEGADRGRAAFVGSNPAMAVRVERGSEGDAIDLQARVAAVADAMRPALPAGVTMDLVRTRAEQITERLSLMFDNAATGLALVVLMLFLFLNGRIALWVAAGIPVATLAAIAVMWAGGLTLNMISLFALILVLGVIVDDSIVVGEHADFRVRHLGEAPVVAAERAAVRMAGPVLASTLTTVIAFLALAAIGGRFGDLIRDIPLTVMAVMVASLVECFLILPNHMASALADSVKEKWYDAPSRWTNRQLDRFRRAVMRPLMREVIAARYPVLAAAVLVLATQVALFLRGDVPFRFFNAPEQSSLTGNFAMLPGADRADSVAMMQELQRAVAAVGAAYEAEHGLNPVLFVMAEVGGGAGRGLSGAATKDPDLLGGISVEIVNPDLRPYSSTAFIAAIEAEVRRHPLLEELSFRGGRFGPGGAAISVDLYGAEAGVLKAAAEALKARLAAFPEVSGLEDTLAYDKEELVLALTPTGQAMGFTVEGLARDLRDRLAGIEAATFPDGPRSAAIRVELPADELTADFLERTRMRAGPGVHVPLADIVTVRREAGFSSVVRENGLRVVTVSGDLAEDDPARAAEIQQALRDSFVPEVEQDFGVQARFSGQAEQEREFLGGAQVSVALALVGIYLCLAWIFASWTRPVVVMSVIPFALVGAIFGHWVWDVPLSMFSIVGIIGMSGIIVNDSIVLVATIDEYSRRRGLVPAVVDAVADRLRPVLLTTLTTVLGLAPLLFERSSQAEFLKPTVVTLVFGLGAGMFLVLLVVPAIMVVQADMGRRLRALRRALRLRRAEGRVVRIAAGGVGVVLLTGVAVAAVTGGVAQALALVAAGAAVVTGGAVVAARRG